MKDSEKKAKERIAQLQNRDLDHKVVTNKRGGQSLDNATGDAKTVKDGLLRRALRQPPKGH